MIICNQCDGNNYIKVREIWKDTSQTKKVWITKPCPKCVPITEENLDSIDMITSKEIYIIIGACIILWVILERSENK